MLQFCAFSSQQGRLQAHKKVYITIFGTCELSRLTIARQILAERQAAVNPNRSRGWQFFLTIFGSTEIKVPTLAEEFIDLRELIRSGQLALEDFEGYVADMGQLSASISSLTLFGGFSEWQLPGEDEEVDSIALHRHVGNIPEPATQILQIGIGQRDAERRATVHRAVQIVA